MLPFSASSGFGSEAIVYGASMVLVLLTNVLASGSYSTTAQKKSNALSLYHFAQSSLGFQAAGSGRHAPSRPSPLVVAASP